MRNRIIPGIMFSMICKRQPNQRRFLMCSLLLAAVLSSSGFARADIATVPPFQPRFSADLPLATEVIVHKSARRLELMRNRELLKSYRIALGLNPEGHKQQEGDFRTPEGRYRLNARNPRSDFFLSLAVSYPDKTDVERAKQAGVPPGGAIMIHGLPNNPKWPPEYYARNDWTDGCIALSNSDMMEVWMLVPTGTPIHIRP
jgi:hypothetical protein